MIVKLNKHVLESKIPLLNERGYKIKTEKIKKILSHPDDIDAESDPPKIIASGKLDRKHVLRIVYKVEDGIIKVITVYPAEKGRYY